MRRRFLSNINKSIYGYFIIEALEDGLTAKLSAIDNACKYCIDNGSWNTLSAGSNTPSINTGQTLSFKGNLTPYSSCGIGTFTISKKCNLKGNIMSLLYGDDFSDKTDLRGKSYAFYNLFKNCANIVDASNLILSATTLGSSCYSYMFEGCTSLTTAPELPATTLANYCYHSMFQGCSSLITAPTLPATTLADACYRFMFNECSSLTTAPVLPATTLTYSCYSNMFGSCTSLTTAPTLTATTLASTCYESMFRGCTGLTTAPELPATTLAWHCYDSMFYGCSNLNYIKMLATYISFTSDYLSNWVYGVSSTGTFVKHPDMTSLPSGNSGIPTGWTVVNDGETAPNLITFTVGGGSKYGIEDKTYTAIEGMTFGEFVNSEYNIDGWSLSYDEYANKTRILHQYDDVIYDGGGESLFDTNVILESEDYRWM